MPDNGSLTLDGVAIGLNDVVSVVQLAAGELVFTPTQDFFGTTSFEYAVRSIDEYSLPATVTLNIASVPDRPLLQSDPPEELLFTEAVDAAAQSLAVPLLPLQFIDRDSASLSVETSFELTLVKSVSPIPKAVTQALENALSITTSITPLGSGTMLTISPTLSSAPMNLDFLQAGESIRFRYKLIVSDGDGLRSGVIIPLELTGSNDAPIASNFETSIQVGEVSTTDANLLIHVTDPDAGDQPRLISVNDTVFGDRSSIFLPTVAGVLQINSDGSYSFPRTPSIHFQAYE
ncbi:MAG: Ig-like domain-containing protein, partial [Burkholderiaceae bacterium]